MATIIAMLVVMMVGPASASAEPCPSHSAYTNCLPGWELSARNYPTNIAPGHKGAIQIEVFNVGAGSSGGTVTVTDTLPPGVTATEAGDLATLTEEPENIFIEHNRWDCTGNGTGEAPKVAGASVVTCVNDPSGMPSLLGGAGNTGVGSEGNAQIAIAVQVEGGTPEAPEHPLPNEVIVAGGGAPTPATTTDPITISSTPSDFRFTNFDFWLSNSDGTLDTQPGSHPYALTVSFGISAALAENKELSSRGNELRNIEVGLPPGFVGDPTAPPQCSRPDFTASTCPRSSQVGFTKIETIGPATAKMAVFNLVPPPGMPAEFGFKFGKLLVYLDTSVRSGSDYGITTSVTNSPQQEVLQAITTFWGVPGDPTHDRWRPGSEKPCTQEQMEKSEKACSHIENPILEPFLTLPTGCAGIPEFTLRSNTWEHPEAAPIEATAKWRDSNGIPTGLSGCENLGFGPGITTAPDTSSADTPAGLTVEVKPPVGGLSNPNGLGTSDIQNTTVTLPEGLVINPGQAAGLQACQTAQSAVGTEGPPSCPLASKVGTVKAKSPLVEAAAEKELEGNVYVMQSNPPNLKLLAAFSADGVNIKLVLNVHLDEATGQLKTTVANIPEFPVSDFKLSFSGGPQAALDTPTQCGAYTTNADFTPWASPFLADFNTSASFGITAGPGGGACPPQPLPFAPTLTAGSTTDQAGAFTNFSLLLERGDGQQRIEKLQFKEPAGLAGLIASVPLCDEANANAGTCAASSHIGHAVVTSGPGPYPLVLPQPGAPELPIYLTGPYKGAPFGLSIVTPVIAGPFNLGTVITRAKIEIDPRTAQITITTDALPQIVDGVPTDLRSINSIIDRPGFLFNPTNCTPAEFTGTAWGTPPPGAAGPGATAAISSHFGVGSCRELGFHPTVAVTTAARSSKANGASLFFNIAYPKGPLGKESWFNEAKFDLPKQLPARLTTIQKACLASVFEANPAGCPPASLIGHATVHTPVLPVPLQGPVYFVSHGGAKFPDAVLVLQGDGVTVDLTGETFINGKTGVTSATFRNTPDVPFENIEVTLPAGPFSEFAATLPSKAKGSFCGQKLLMPTKFVAQNGLELNQSIRLRVTGCPNAKRLVRAEELARATKACKRRAKSRREACIRAARRKYGQARNKGKK